jgi:hypothetical protein
VVNCFKKNLRSYPKDTQKDICDEIYHLHSSISQEEFEDRYRVVAGKWRTEFPEFARYCNGSWVISPPGRFIAVSLGLRVQSMLWSPFNSTLKKSYTLNSRHTLSALLDIFIERLVFDVSMDLNDLRKSFQLRRLPAVEIKVKSEKIDDTSYFIREHGNSIVTYRKHGNTITYSMYCSTGSCTCRYFMKMGCCKHILHAHTLLNEDSDYIIIDCRFKNKGNTKITKRQRGRVLDALPASQRM